jgi:hypothetical protein
MKQKNHSFREISIDCIIEQVTAPHPGNPHWHLTEAVQRRQLPQEILPNYSMLRRKPWQYE